MRTFEYFVGKDELRMIVIDQVQTVSYKREVGELTIFFINGGIETLTITNHDLAKEFLSRLKNAIEGIN